MQVPVRGAPGSAAVEGWEQEWGGRGWAGMEPQGPQLTPLGSLRAEITFRVVPRWVGRPGLSPGLGQSLGVGFPWKEEEPE